MRLFKILNGICQYLAARNKTLWSGTWSSGSITVPDTDKYRTFIIKFGTQYMTAIRNLDDRITGTLFFASNNGQNVYQNLFTATVSGNRWTFKTQTQFGHYGSSSHSAFQQINPAYVVEEIVGLEPILGEFVNIGGGYCVAAIFLGRWRLHEALYNLKRYYPNFKEYYLDQAKQNMDENWEWTRYGPIFLDRIYGSERICNIRGCKSRPTHPSINRAIERVHNAICGILQQCNICHPIENISSNSKSACRIYGEPGDLRPVTGVLV